MNSSIVTLTNNSILEEADGDLEYSKFIKRFDRPDLYEPSKVELIGCQDIITALTRKIELLKDPNSSGFNSALLTGPTGTGKTTFVKKLAERYSGPDGWLTFFHLESAWTLERQFGNIETRLRSLLSEAVQNAPSLIFIDEIDLICAEKRPQNESNRVFNVLRDKIKSLGLMSSNVLVLAATDKPEVLDPQIRKDGYFRNEIRFTLPKPQDRIEILKHLLGKYENQLSDDQIKQISDGCHCYSYGDLRNICRIARERCDNAPLDYSSIKLASKQYKPIAIESITTPCPPLRWEDIGGVEDVKMRLQESVIWPLERPQEFQEAGIPPNKGALLYGPPGCSKTMLAKALATQSGYNFIAINGPELFSKWVGDSEAALRKLYRNAREIAPCIIFFDEIDGLVTGRNDNQSSSVGDKMVAQLLPLLDGIEPLDHVFTIGATNRPDRVDKALLRPGRLDPAIYIPLPSENDRRAIFKVHMRPMRLRFDPEPTESIVNKLAALTNGYSGAEIWNVCKVAGVLMLRESSSDRHVEWRHFERALDEVKPRTNTDQLKAYEKFQGETLQFGAGTSEVHEDSLVRISKLNRLMRSLRLKTKTK